MNAPVGSGGSEFNHLPEVRARSEFAADVFVVDSTIRSLQSGVSGSLHSADDLVEIGMSLDRLGVRELIVNVSWRDGPEVIAELARRRPRPPRPSSPRSVLATNLPPDGLRTQSSSVRMTSASSRPPTPTTSGVGQNESTTPTAASRGDSLSGTTTPRSLRSPERRPNTGRRACHTTTPTSAWASHRRQSSISCEPFGAMCPATPRSTCTSRTSTARRR
jgi:hypothetical protein